MRRRKKAAIVLLLAAVVWIFVAPLLAERLIIKKKLEKADAILVLSGSSVYRERAETAAAVYRQGIAPQILLTDDGERAGWSVEEETNPAYVELTRRELIGRGVPPEAIAVLPGKVSGTIDEAEVLRKTAAEKGWNSVLLVTSAYHTRRAVRTFEKVFAEHGLTTQIGIESAPAGRQTPNPSYWWLTPRGWRSVAGEYVKSLYYWIFY